MTTKMLRKSALPKTFEITYHDDAFLGPLEFLHFQLAPGLGRKRHDTVPVTI